MYKQPAITGKAGQLKKRKAESNRPTIEKYDKNIVSENRITRALPARVTPLISLQK